MIKNFNLLTENQLKNFIKRATTRADKLTKERDGVIAELRLATATLHERYYDEAQEASDDLP